MTVRAERPFFFPVADGPIVMRPGLFRLGTDFGNGEVDASFFVQDAQVSQQRAEKARVLARAPERVALSGDPRHRAAQEGVLHWMLGKLGLSAVLTADGNLETLSRELTRRVPEDFVMLAGAGTKEPRVALVSVCFPSGWAPETILGKTFSEVHAPVPAFPAATRRPEALTEALIERGPYVRFVWTLSADDALDHHPSQPRREWAHARSGWFRVERQVTVPFPHLGAGLFLIRTFLTPFADLSPRERARLANALRSTSNEILAYKGLRRARSRILALLENGPPRGRD